jgi:hypothetical protein
MFQAYTNPNRFSVHTQLTNHDAYIPYKMYEVHKYVQILLLAIYQSGVNCLEVNSFTRYLIRYRNLLSGPV